MHHFRIKVCIVDHSAIRAQQPFAERERPQFRRYPKDLPLPTRPIFLHPAPALPSPSHPAIRFAGPSRAGHTHPKFPKPTPPGCVSSTCPAGTAVLDPAQRLGFSAIFVIQGRTNPSRPRPPQCQALRQWQWGQVKILCQNTLRNRTFYRSSQKSVGVQFGQCDAALARLAVLRGRTCLAPVQRSAPAAAHS